MVPQGPLMLSPAECQSGLTYPKWVPGGTIHAPSSPPIRIGEIVVAGGTHFCRATVPAPIRERELERATWGSGGAPGREVELVAVSEWRRAGREADLAAAQQRGRSSSRRHGGEGV
jgi:hypothetical protein